MPMPGMDRPPLPSPDIQAQMGTPQGPPPPGAGISSIAQRNAAQGPAGAAGGPNPHGFLLAQVEAVKKVLDQIAGAEPIFAPFAQKAIQSLDTGVSAVSTAPKAPNPEAMGGGPAGGIPPGASSGPGGGGIPPMG
jgi:hypothetical protein